MILSCDKISNLALGPSTKWVCDPDAKATEQFLGPYLLTCYLSILCVLALSLGQAPHLNSVFKK